MKQLISHLLGFCWLVCFKGTQCFTSDVDRCQDSFTCPAFAKCENVPGGYHCTCKRGFASTSGEQHFTDPTVKCVVDRCRKLSTCPPFATCENISGGYQCTCNRGFASSSGEEHFTDPTVKCIVDRCQNSSTCPAFATCENVSGAYRCTCKHGFASSSGEEQFTDPTVKCIDVDECSQVLSVCGPHSICINTPGSFICQCSPGYSSPRGTSWNPVNSNTLNCTVDRCQNSSTCPSFAKCENVPGGYHCTCNHGFASTSGEQHFTDPTVKCIVDRCQNSSTCPVFATCENVLWGYHCTCKHGFASSSGEQNFTDPKVKCVDVDECSQDPPVCGPHNKCNNTRGSFTCQCSPGYSSASGTSWKPGDSHTLNCTENLLSCQPRIMHGDDFKSLCGNSTQHGNQQSNTLCTFLNQTSKSLESACGNGNQSLPPKEVSTSIDLLFNATAQQINGSKKDVALVAKMFLQSVESAALVAALKSPGNETQTITGDTMTIAALRVTDNCSRAGKMIELNAENELMSIDCTTVVGASEAGSGVVAFISYATLESILNNNFIDQQNLTGEDNLVNITLNSKVVSGTIGKPGPLPKPFYFTLEHKQVIGNHVSA
uniref:Adhesion G protein-coupled receptor E1 n=1 Tax=Chrysemys picta bellii TaxID=8478 RepID=A0A8C3F7U8_CHRPI